MAEEIPHRDVELGDVLWKADPELTPLVAAHRELGGKSWQRLDGVLADYFEDVFPEPNVPAGRGRCCSRTRRSSASPSS